MVPFARVWETLNEAGVRYVVVGGVAALLHGNNRATADIDIVVDLQPDEARKAVEKLLGIGLRSRLPVDPLRFADPAERRRWRDEKHIQVFSMYDPAHPSVVVDLFVEPPMDFDALYRQSIVVRLPSSAVRICSVQHLIEMKEKCGRPQDVIDAANLRLLQERAGEQAGEASP
jgi:hypothetical protein